GTRSEASSEYVRLTVSLPGEGGRRCVAEPCRPRFFFGGVFAPQRHAPPLESRRLLGPFLCPLVARESKRLHALHTRDAANPQLLAYSKRSVDRRDLILVIINLDPASMQHGFVQLPLVEWAITPHATVEVFDLLSAERYFWRGEWNYVRLDPQDRVAHILHVQLAAPLPPSSSHA